MSKNNKCPKCKSNKWVLPIAYGLPDRDLIEAIKSNKAILGGCVITPDSPSWGCQKCKSRFG